MILKSNLLRLLFLLFTIHFTLIAGEKFTPSENKTLAIVYTFDMDIKEKFDDFVTKDLKEIGFFLNDPHKNVNKVYEKAYGSTVLDNLAFSSIVNEATARPMFNIDPRLAGFSPFNLLIYKTLKDKETYVSHLTPEAILDILEIDDPKIREPYIKSFEPLTRLIKEKLGGKKSTIPLKGYAKDTMMNFEIPFEEPDDIDEFLEEFQEKFEKAFVEKKYIIAGFYNFKESFNSDHDDLEGFDSFWSYALCHLTFSYNIFDKEKGLPAAGIFAPCSMYIYVKSGENKLVIGMPTLSSWGAALGITDKEKLNMMLKLDTEIPEIIKSLGGIATPNANPLADKMAVTAIAKVAPITSKTDNSELSQILALLTKLDKKVENLEKRLIQKQAAPSSTIVHEVVKTPTTTTTIKKKKKSTLPARIPKKASQAGYVKKTYLPSHIEAPYASTKQIIADLENAGFEVLATTPLDKSATLHAITFTSTTLKEMASKDTRGFIGVMKVLVDDKNKFVNMTNPLYFAKAYMQKDFDKSGALEVLDALNEAFEGLKDSRDIQAFDDLVNFHFMVSMPYYQEMLIVGKGDNKELLAKAQQSGKTLFSLSLPSGGTLLGFKLSKRTGTFIKKIGLKNAGVLPYLIMIEKGEAKVLDPKYDIALHYPELSMNTFSSIATAPGAIVKEAEKMFK